MIYFLRHAHTDWNGPPKRYQGRMDVSLSDRGRQAALDFSSKVQSLNIKAVYASPLKRCRETLACVLPRVSDVVWDERLLEIDMGVFSGKTQEELHHTYPDQLATWLSRPADAEIELAESLMTLQSRALSFIEALEGEDNGNVLVVTHGGVIRSLACHFHQLNLNEYHSVIVNNLDVFSLHEHRFQEVDIVS